ncbi:MAG: acetoacetate decarboxylase family protein [Myxococcota bacterium]
MSDTQPSYRIQGREVGFPVVVREASSGAATYLVSSKAARALLPGAEFELVELLPGRAVCVIAIIDYKDNDLGDYNEVSVALFVRPRGERAKIPYLGNWLELTRGELGVHILHLPVNQSFTCEAGCTIWGYPKTVEEVEFDYTADRASCKLVIEGKHALTLSVPRGGSKALPESEMKTWSYVDGAPHVVRAQQGAEGFGMRFGGAELTLGTGTIADQLRSLGLPKRPLMCTWMEKFHARFGPAEKL